MTDDKPKGLHVYQAITKITKELSVEGLAKTKAAGGGLGYAFRGIDAVYNILSGLLSANNLNILPRVVGRETKEYESKNGSRMVNTVVDVEFDLVSSIDGSTHTVRTIGEAMDTSDKSCNKAMSCAYKYMAFMMFCIPTEGDNDTENNNPQAEYKKPGPLPKTVSVDERKRNAGLYLSRVIGITPATDKYKEFKAQVEASQGDWITAALDAEQEGVTNYVNLMRFVNGELEGDALREEVSNVFNG